MSQQECQAVVTIDDQQYVCVVPLTGDQLMRWIAGDQDVIQHVLAHLRENPTLTNTQFDESNVALHQLW